jgi:hypothetical protein
MLPRGFVKRVVLASAPFLAALLVAACRRAPDLSREAAADLIARSPAFEGPWDPGIRFGESQSTMSAGDAKRRLLRVESVLVKEDGPWGWAGTTATVPFVWRWQNGPLAGFDYRSKAKLHCAGGVWKVYNDQLQEELWKAERGEE